MTEPVIEFVTRHSDGKRCAFFVRGGISPVEFVALFARTIDLEAMPPIDAVYCEFWKIKKRRNGGTTIERSAEGEARAFPVTGYDVVKWKR